MTLIEDLFKENAAARIVEIQNREAGSGIKGDFDGSVTGSWVKLDESGLGIVSYNQKQYKTRPLGFTSIAAGHSVYLSYAAGTYYSTW